MAAACSVGNFSISRITSRVSDPPAPITTGTRWFTTSMVKRAMRTFSSRDKVGVSPVVPNDTIYSTPPAITCSITLARAGSSMVRSDLNGVTSATPVPDNKGMRLLMIYGYGFINYFRFRFRFRVTMMNNIRLIRIFIPESHFIKFFDAVFNEFFRRKFKQVLDGLNDVWFQ